MDFDTDKILGNFSRAFDIISSEYGWTDDVILDLYFCRFRQISTAIAQRQYEAKRVEDLRTSWMTRTISSYVAAGYMVDGENKAVEQAGLLSIDPVEAEFLEKAKDIPVQKEPERGSYEKLMGLFQQKRS